LLLARGGDLLSRLVGDVEALENAGLRAFVPMLGAVLLAAGVLIALPALSLAGVAAVGLVTAGLIAPLLGGRMGARPSRHLTEARGALQARIVDGLRGLAELTVLGAVPSHQRSVEAEARSLARSQDGVARAGAAGSAIGALAADFTALAALVLGASLVLQGSLAGERLTGVVLLTLAAFEATVGLPAAFAALGSARSAERRIVEVLEAGPAVAEPTSPKPAGPGLRLEVRDLRFTYPGVVRPTLDGVSLELAPGRVVALVQASPRSPGCWRASGRFLLAPCFSTGWTFATSPRTTCAPGSPCWGNPSMCSADRCARTCAWPAPKPARTT